jgi:hypothetical protein
VFGARLCPILAGFGVDFLDLSLTLGFWGRCFIEGFP